MKKLVLNLDALEVESFDATPQPATEPGTVRGQQLGSTYDQFLCECSYGGPDNGSCDVSCGGTCYGGNETCGGPCLTVPYCPSSPGYYGC